MRHSPSQQGQPEAADAGCRLAPMLPAASAGPDYPAEDPSGAPPFGEDGGVPSGLRADGLCPVLESRQPGPPLPRQGLFSLSALLADAVLGTIVLAFLLFAIVIGGLPGAWIYAAAWGWSLIFATHLGATVTRRRLLGAHVGLSFPLSLGLIRIDLLDSSLVWSPWVVGIFATSVLIHAGMNFVRHPPEVLREPSPASRSVGVTMPIGRALPTAVASRAPARTEMSFGMKIATAGLGAFALFSALAALWAGVSDPSGADRLRRSGTGNVWWTMPVETFDRIEITGDAQITVRSGATPEVIASGRDTVVPLVEARVTNGFLQISLPPAAQQEESRNGPSLAYEIIVPTLSELRLDGSTSARIEIGPQEDGLDIVIQGNASATVANLAVPEVSVVARDDSSVALSGTAENLAVTASGHARVQAQALQAQHVNVMVSETANAVVTATGILAGHVTDDGTVQYDGHPTIGLRVSASGSLVPLHGSDRSTPAPARPSLSWSEITDYPFSQLAPE